MFTIIEVHILSIGVTRLRETFGKVPRFNLQMGQLLSI